MQFSSGYPDVLDRPKSRITIPEPTPASLATWLAELPLANVDYCSDAVLAVLQAFNAKPDLSAQIRFDLAEMLRPCAAMLAQQTEGRFINAPLPYPPWIARYARIGVDLHRETGNLYGLTCSAPGLPDNPCLAACYRAIQHWGLSLLRTAQLYREADQAFWTNLYRIYHRAETQGAQSTQFPDDDEPPACRTPLGQFKRILLFTLADSYRFRQRDMGMIFRLLGELAHEADLVSEPVAGEQRAWFRIDLDSNRAPARIHEPDAPDPSSRFLFTGRLVHKLLDEPPEQRNRHTERRELDPARLSLHLAKSLHAVEYRRSTRVLLHQKCLLFIGLDELIHALSPSGTPQKDAASQFALPPPGLTDRTKPSRLELQPLDMEILGDLRLDGQAFRTGTTIERILLDSWDCQRENIWNASTDGGSPMAGNGWEGELINTGSRGYGVLYCDKGNPHIQVGALVGISEHRRLPYIGIIRWLISSESCLQFGVELLSPNAEAVQLWDRSGKCRGQGLMLPAVPPLRSDPELLAAPTGFSTGTLLRLVGQKTRAGFYLGKVREAALAFARFQLIPDLSDMQDIPVAEESWNSGVVAGAVGKTSDSHPVGHGDPHGQPSAMTDPMRMRRPPQVKIIRRALRLSQEEFATRYHIPLAVLRDLEQSGTEPDPLACAYLTVIAHDPEGVRRALRMASA
jgi:DNA-binding transcriptional regulator YiaG